MKEDVTGIWTVRIDVRNEREFFSKLRTCYPQIKQEKSWVRLKSTSKEGLVTNSKGAISAEDQRIQFYLASLEKSREKDTSSGTKFSETE